MSEWQLNAVLVLLFVLLGGYFSASEIALVSLRDAQVRRLAGRGLRGRAVARMREDPSRFLSTVQIGVTVAGFFAASYGGATLAVELGRVLVGLGLSEGASSTVALIAVTVVVSFVSLVLGELAPKRLAMQRTETVALTVAPVLQRAAQLFRPAIWLLSVSTDATVRLFGVDPKAKPDEVSEEELRDMVGTHEQLTAEERQVLTDVFTATDRVLSEVMVPRTEVDFLSGSLTVEEAAEYMSSRSRSRYPVTGLSTDDILGVAHVRDVLTAVHRRDLGHHAPATVAELVRQAAMLPGSLPLIQALSRMRRRSHLAIIVDEYGGTDGIVTLEDLLEELIGDIEDEHDPRRQPIGLEPDGTIEVDGLMHRDDVRDLTGIDLPPGRYNTLAGFVIEQLGDTPEVGDRVNAAGHRFTVLEMDGRRASRVRIAPLSGGSKSQLSETKPE